MRRYFVTAVDPETGGMTATEDAVLAQLSEAYPAVKRSADGQRLVGLCEFIFTWAILAGLDEFGYADRWCYETRESAEAALDKWAGNIGTEPDGWHRHPDSGRRRPDGDPAREYFNP